ncbi:MAG TPA: folylpolyglutamate synthase/dihydrofolate synthase family protein [Blastocatellia bacterium]|nr:folylpolyglutamate synthase/dihydrofolate synthase family protein [Blastocatellia bacterium]
MDYSEAVRYLYGLGHEVLSAKYRLETIRLLLESLDSPQQTFKSVIVAGTNGKGSTAAMIESAARRAGHRTALYTSPHLVRIEERIHALGQPISESDFASVASQVRIAAETLVSQGSLDAVPTFFEQVTAAAFLYFRKAGIDLAILEVGLGGRLDATNVVDPILSVITLVDYDHQEVLGHDIAEIAAEKAAVIKPGSRAVIARQAHAAASEVLMQRCLEVNVLPVFAGDPGSPRATSDGRFTFDYVSARATYSSIRIGLRGSHQIDNAVAAVEALEIVSDSGFPVPRQALIDGLREVDWPGRLEMTDTQPRLLLDGAHNPSGASRLREYLQTFWPEPMTMVFGAMADKDIAGMSAELFPLARTIVLTRVGESRAATGAAIGEAALAGSRNVIFTETVKQALSWARSITGPDGLIVVAGSLYLVGEVKRLLEEEDKQTAFGLTG